jgi:hypothetical protein
MNFNEEQKVWKDHATGLWDQRSPRKSHTRKGRDISKSVQYYGKKKTLLISDTKLENVFCEKVWLDCVEKCKMAHRDVVVIQWKETGETISVAVDGFNLKDVLELRPLEKEEKIPRTA